MSLTQICHNERELKRQFMEWKHGNEKFQALWSVKIRSCWQFSKMGNSPWQLLFMEHVRLYTVLHFAEIFYQFYYNYLLIWVFLSPELVGGSHWNSSDNKSPHVSSTLLGILADLDKSIVWMVFTCSLTSMSSSRKLILSGLSQVHQPQLVSQSLSCSIVCFF